jgi:hypothetical protein
MAKQTATELLKERISVLEIKQTEQGIALKQEFMEAYESLKPVNLLKNSVKEFTSSLELKRTLFETVVVLINGFITKTLVFSSNSNPLLKLIATLLQLVATNVIANHRDNIYQFITRWTEKLFSSTSDKKVEPGSFCE